MTETVLPHGAADGPGTGTTQAPLTLLRALILGRSTVWPTEWPASAADDFIGIATTHGVHALAGRAMKHAAGWPESVVRSLEDLYQRGKAVELLKRAELEKVIGALNREGVRPVILKGTALAYGLYPSPALRPRGDTDLLIRVEDRETAFAVLDALGYVMREHSGGTHISNQRTLERIDRFGVLHAFDVHWKISNSPLLGECLRYPELLERAVPLAGIGINCPGIARTDALLHACLHRLIHRFAPYYSGEVVHYGDRLIWLYDVHLLVETMTAAEHRAFATLALDRGLAAVCRDGIRSAAACFETAASESVLELLNAPARREPAAALLNAGGARRLLLDLGALPDIRSRVAFLKEHLFPPGSYMRERYGVRHDLLLPVFYVGRGVSGAWRRLTGPHGGSGG